MHNMHHTLLFVCIRVETNKNRCNTVLYSCLANFFIVKKQRNLKKFNENIEQFVPFMLFSTLEKIYFLIKRILELNLLIIYH